MKDNTGRNNLEKLRQRATEALRADLTGGKAAPSGDFEKAIHEIEVYQVELEMQNEQLIQTQVELANTQQRYYDYFEFAPVGYLTMDQGGRITEINLSGSIMLGSEKNELLGRGFLGLVADRDQGSFQAHLRETIKSDNKCLCTLNIDRPGLPELVVDLQSTALVCDDPEKCSIMTTITDITAQWRAEADIRSKQHFITRITETIPSVIYIYDLEKERAVYANHQLQTMMGYSLEDLVAMAPRAYEKIMHEDDQPIWKAFLLGCATLREGEIREINYRLQHASGGWRWIHSRNIVFARSEEGEPTQILGIADDITPSVEMTEALTASEERYALLVESMNDGLILHDEEGRIHFVNEKLRQTLGYSPEEMMGQTLLDFVEDPGNASGTMTRIMTRMGERKQNFEEPLRRRDGKLMRFRISTQPLFDAANNSKGSFSVLTDITELRYLRQRTELAHGFEGLIGRDEQMLELFEMVRSAAMSSFPVLLQGESGTGKELVALALHNLSSRAGGNFVPVNCGAVPESLFESEFFGHVKGSFTGAIRDKKGRFELAHGGTIFLDEIAELSIPMQVKLLRTLQDGTYERVGDERTRRSNVRVICATNKDLGAAIAAGRFRNDLFYRLSAVPLHLPPLRERRGDIPLLADHIIRQLALESGKPEISISPEALNLLVVYSWPGNVRELQNAIQYACFKNRWQTIDTFHLPATIQEQGGRHGVPTKKRRRKVDAGAIAAAIRDCQGKKTAAAKKLGISRATLYRLLRE